ncbi:hypothetical protein NYP18_09720 [Corynebacterium sp. YIM 101645]|uniref:Secreted protein n=1 Tax=Corynebacterium lemuris TaxID=1859292 RepID=A0ABT2G0X2_9CORY|nr:hypothetical protein [Corynebacterium lemuris]MCS5479932.1 hypothetical protein [Corynebacterium lemuris]
MASGNGTTARVFSSAVQVATALGALVLIGVILWIDVATTIWQEMVILSGLAAGLVTFLLTTVFVNRFLARQVEARWAPVTHMALTSLLHQLADEESSDLSRGDISPRTLEIPTAADAHGLRRELDKLRSRLLKEQNHLTGVLGTWSGFLTSTGDNGDILRAAAQLALQLDHVRDLALEAEEHLVSPGLSQDDHPGWAELATQIESCNQHHAALISALQTRKREHTAEWLRRAPRSGAGA